MSEQPPVLLLDFDGVINAHGPYADIYKKGQRRYNPHWDCQMSNGVAHDKFHGYSIWWAQPLADRLIGLHHSGLLEIQWCSTWNSHAGEIENLLGWPMLTAAFPVGGLHHSQIAQQKRRAAAERCASGRRLIWVDDTEVPYEWELAHAVMAENGRALLIRPKEALGLMPSHLDLIELFCKESGEATSA